MLRIRGLDLTWLNLVLKNIQTSSLWHSIMESLEGSLREDKANGDDDDKVMDLTPMSQPVGDRITFPPNARLSIWSNTILILIRKTNNIIKFGLWSVNTKLSLQKAIRKDKKIIKGSFTSDIFCFCCYYLFIPSYTHQHYLIQCILIVHNLIQSKS